MYLFLRMSWSTEDQQNDNESDSESNTGSSSGEVMLKINVAMYNNNHDRMTIS